MIDLEILTQLGLAGGLLTYIWNDAKKRNEKTEIKVEVLEKRVQKIEDIQGNKLDALSSEFKEFKHDINEKLETLKEMVHKNRNLENQMNTMLSILVKRHEKDFSNEKDND
jgi:hypothetical protein